MTTRHGRTPDVTAAVGAFRSAFGAEPMVAVSPGRVNLIGDHTDYNEGCALPMAIDRHAVAAFRPRTDGILRARSVVFAEERQASIDGLAPGCERGWFAYVAGVSWSFREAGRAAQGMDLVLDGDIPIGGALSSSAAVEVAVARALSGPSEDSWNPLEAARLCQRAENEFVGLRCGILDQLACAAATASTALLIDCRTLDTRSVSIPNETAIVVMDTAVRRDLTDSPYNARRRSCEEAVERLRQIAPSIHSLRDVDDKLLGEGASLLDPDVVGLVRHVIAETLRPAEMAEALEGGEPEAAGRLMNESHESLRTLYRVSSPELDLMSELARAHPACHGARMTGAGFAGCAVALVRSEAVDRMIREVESAYRERSGRLGELFACHPVAGARLV